MHRAARTGREHAAIDQLQRRIKLIGEIFRTSAIVGERRDGGGADTLRARLGGELLLPALEAGGGVSALRSARLTGHGDERSQAHQAGDIEALKSFHWELSWVVLKPFCTANACSRHGAP